MSEKKNSADEVFGFFTEIGIINQLSTAMFAKSLPEGVHPSHFAILNHLVRLGDGKPPLQIANAMQVSKNTMTHSLKTLQDRGFIDVQPDPEDGRGKRVYMTEKGRVFRKEGIVRVSETFGHVIGDEQIDLMRRILGDLQLMRQHLDNNR